MKKLEHVELRTYFSVFTKFLLLCSLDITIGTDVKDGMRSECRFQLGDDYYMSCRQCFPCPGGIMSSGFICRKHFCDKMEYCRDGYDEDPEICKEVATIPEDLQPPRPLPDLNTPGSKDIGDLPKPPGGRRMPPWNWPRPPGYPRYPLGGRPRPPGDQTLSPGSSPSPPEPPIYPGVD